MELKSFYEDKLKKLANAESTAKLKQRIIMKIIEIETTWFNPFFDEKDWLIMF